MKNGYEPALIIGAGGSGVRVLRFLHSIAQDTSNRSLKQAQAEGRLQLLGIDTDPMVNAYEESISAQAISWSHFNDPGSVQPPRNLLTLPKLHLCDYQEVINAVKRIATRDGDGPDAETRHIGEAMPWFPQDEGMIAPGHAALSSQLRPLGRLALFLNAQEIYNELREALRNLRQAVASPYFDVYVVNSLAGSTGSGMFWDLGFLVRKLAPETRITGMFLLPEPFEFFTQSNRIHANTYAALKELYYFKNWIKPLTVVYPIEPKLIFQGKVHESSVFERVMLFGESPAGTFVENRDQATVDVTCYRIAQNLLTLQRTDLRPSYYADQGADTIAPVGSLERTFCFGTMVAQMFQPLSSHGLLGYLELRLKACGRQSPQQSSTPPLAFDELVQALELAPLLEGQGLLSTKPEVVQTLITQLRQCQDDLSTRSKVLALGELAESYLPEILRYPLNNLQPGQDLFQDKLSDIYGAALKIVLAQPLQRTQQLLADLIRQKTVLDDKAVEQLASQLKALQSQDVTLCLECPCSVLGLEHDSQAVQKWPQLQASFSVLLADLIQYAEALPSLNAPELRSLAVRLWLDQLPDFLEKLRELSKPACLPEPAVIFSYTSVGYDALHAQDLLNFFRPSWSCSEPPRLGTSVFDELFEQLSAWRELRLEDQEARVLAWLLERLPQRATSLDLEAERFWSQALTNLVDGMVLRATQLRYEGRAKDFEALIHRSRSRVFNDGLLDNRIQRKSLILKPFALGIPRPARSFFAKELELACQRVFGRIPRIDASANDTPVTVYLDLFRSAEEIHKINEYFAAYQRESPQNRAIFHIDKRFAEFAEILSHNSDMTVFCGNENCRVNLRRHPRSERFCPGCAQPILNFCGNPDCHAVNILEQIEQRNAGQRQEMRRIPHHCPECANELHNYWWPCPDHLERNPIDKLSCKMCLEEYHNGTRSLTDVSKRPDRQFISCAGCEELENDDHYRIQIKPALKEFYKDGVNGHESRVFHAALNRHNQSTSPKLSTFLCPNGVSEHFLFPTCPVGREDKNLRHHVYRSGSGKFFCTRHPQMRFFTCFHCDFPVEAEKMVQRCPRCLKQLGHCYYCSEAYMSLYPPLAIEGAERCPNCTNLMQLTLDLSADTAEVGLKNPAFCPNVFGCAAAAHPWDTACEFKEAPCKVCRNAQRVPLDMLYASVSKCPLCILIMSPVPKGMRRVKITTDEILDRKGHFQNYRCQICGCSSDRVLDWLEQPVGPAQSNEPAPSAVNLTKRPTIAFNQAITILRTLRNERDRTLVFQQLRDVLKGLGGSNQLRMLMDNMLEFFNQDSEFHKILFHRVQGLLEEYERQHQLFHRWSEPGPIKTSRRVL